LRDIRFIHTDAPYSPPCSPSAEDVSPWVVVVVSSVEVVVVVSSVEEVVDSSGFSVEVVSAGFSVEVPSAGFVVELAPGFTVVDEVGLVVPPGFVVPAGFVVPPGLVVSPFLVEEEPLPVVVSSPSKVLVVLSSVLFSTSSVIPG